MPNAATLWSGHQMGQGAVARADFAPDRELCRAAHIGLTFTFPESQICRSSWRRRSSQDRAQHIVTRPGRGV